MKSLLLSVIIPTYNRKEILDKSLAALFNQTYPKSNYEIIVIDDGSTDGTERKMKEIMENSSVSLKYFRQENKGPAAARNVGIKNAKGEILLFIGDDIIATSNLIEEHVNYHNLYPKENTAILGYVTWHPDLEVTPFMYWLENGGPQFSFNAITEDKKENCGNFCTVNISLKRQFLLHHGLFSEDFPYASHEDIELGYRLEEKGLKIIYKPSAVGYHMHPVTISDYCEKRQIKAGISEVIFWTKNHRFRQTLEANVDYYKELFCSDYFLKDMEHLIKIVEKIELFLNMDYSKLCSIYEILTNFYFRKGSLIKLKEGIPNFDSIKERCLVAIKAEKEKDYELAIRNYKEAISIHPQYLPLRFILAKLFEDIDKYTQAALEYKEILREDPSHFRAILSLANALSFQAKYKEAEEQLKNALSLEPLDRNIKANILTTLANIYSKQQNFKEAEEKLNEALSLEPPDKNTKASILNQLGNLYTQQQNFKEAEEKLNEALSLEPPDKNTKANTLITLANIYSQQQKYKEAEKELKEILSLGPLDRNMVISIHYALGSLYRRKDDLERAKKKFEEVIKFVEEIPSFINKNKFVGGAHFHLGSIYQRRGDEERTRQHFEECLRFIPDHGKARENLGRL
jgi:glycosyltransferase involved in cell wall biosynthesis